MTLVEAVLMNWTERVCHQRYWHFMLQAMGEEVGTCSSCGRSFLEDPKVWTEQDSIPETK